MCLKRGKKTAKKVYGHDFGNPSQSRPGIYLRDFLGNVWGEISKDEAMNAAGRVLHTLQHLWFY